MIADKFGGVSVDGPGQGAWIGEDGRMLDQKAMYFEVQYFDGVEIIDVR